MRTVRYLAAAAIVSCVSSGAWAAPIQGQVSLPANGSIVQVEGGCGPYAFRDRFGYCRAYGYRPAPPVVRYYRVCPPYTHPTPFGCRPNRYY